MAGAMKEILARYTRKDFRVDCYRGSGPGGQHRNKTDSAVRITHLPSGLVVSSETFKSQHQNKGAAFRRLAGKVLLWHRDKEAVTKARPTEVVRTYHAVENRVKDHATGYRQTYTEVLSDPSAMIETRREHFRTLALSE